MNAFIAFSLLAFFLQDVQVPYKPAEEFEVQIDYQFKQKTGPNPNTIDFVETQEEHDKKRYGTGLRQPGPKIWRDDPPCHRRNSSVTSQL